MQAKRNLSMRIKTCSTIRHSILQGRVNQLRPYLAVTVVALPTMVTDKSGFGESPYQLDDGVETVAVILVFS